MIDLLTFLILGHAYGFLAEIDKNTTNFSHVKRTGNIITHHLDRTTLDSNAAVKLSKNIA